MKVTDRALHQAANHDLAHPAASTSPVRIGTDGVLPSKVIAHQLTPAARQFALWDASKVAFVADVKRDIAYVSDLIAAANEDGHQLDTDECACGSRVADVKIRGILVVACVDSLCPIEFG